MGVKYRQYKEGERKSGEGVKQRKRSGRIGVWKKEAKKEKSRG